jgi:hypothetical protein
MNEKKRASVVRQAHVAERTHQSKDLYRMFGLCVGVRYDGSDWRLSRDTRVGRTYVYSGAHSGDPNSRCHYRPLFRLCVYDPLFFSQSAMCDQARALK